MQEVVSVKCPKAQKEYFTVIKNVRKGHQIQDDGEFQVRPLKIVTKAVEGLGTIKIFRRIELVNKAFFVLILTTAKKIFFLGIKLFCFSR